MIGWRCSGRGPLVLIAGLLLACGQADSQTVEVRDAESEECPAGGTVLLLGGEAQATICNGAEGPTGAQGEVGEVGAEGDPGQAASTGVIRDTLYCTLQDGETFLSVYLWQIEGEVEPLNNVGICRLGEANFADTVPLIGASCSLLSPAKGVVEVQVNAAEGTATASGDMVGEFTCG